MRICVYGAASPTIDQKYIELVEKMEQAMKKNFIRDNCKELYYVTDELDDLLRYIETPVNKIRTVKELKNG